MKMSSRAFRDKYTGAGNDSAKFCQMLSMVRTPQQHHPHTEHTLFPYGEGGSHSAVVVVVCDWQVNITGGKMAPFPGGVLLREGESGAVLGAVGVSGAAGDEVSAVHVYAPYSSVLLVPPAMPCVRGEG